VQSSPAMTNEHRIRAALAAAALLLAACGGGDDTTADDGEATAGSEEEHAHGDPHGDGDHAHPHGDEQAHHAHRMAPAQEAFHDVFAPIWHSDPGPERAAQACDAAAQIQDLGISAASAATEGVEPPSEDDTEAYGAYDDALSLTTEMESTTRLLVVDGCGGDAPDVEIVDQSLGRIHDIFHQAMEAWQRYHAEG